MCVCVCVSTFLFNLMYHSTDSNVNLLKLFQQLVILLAPFTLVTSIVGVPPRRVHRQCTFLSVLYQICIFQYNKMEFFLPLRLCMMLYLSEFL